MSKFQAQNVFILSAGWEANSIELSDPALRHNVRWLGRSYKNEICDPTDIAIFVI